MIAHDMCALSDAPLHGVRQTAEELCRVIVEHESQRAAQEQEYDARALRVYVQVVRAAQAANAAAEKGATFANGASQLCALLKQVDVRDALKHLRFAPPPELLQAFCAVNAGAVPAPTEMDSGKWRTRFSACLE